MRLTEKCREDFEKFYILYIRKNPDVGDRYYDDTLINQFYKWSPSMQFGVYQDFFDKVGINITTYYDIGISRFLGSATFRETYISTPSQWREVIRGEVVKKANKIYNEEEVDYDEVSSF